MQEALDERILEASVAAALDRLRKEQAQLPDKRTALERELSLIETRLPFVEFLMEGKASYRFEGGRRRGLLLLNNFFFLFC